MSVAGLSGAGRKNPRYESALSALFPAKGKRALFWNVFRGPKSPECAGMERTAEIPPPGTKD